MQAVIKTEKLSYSYGKNAVVKDLDLQIHQGDIYGFIGPNGAGKSTTIKRLAYGAWHVGNFCFLDPINVGDFHRSSCR
jgi:ABC-type cobalamin/Fe3+-siderophores transport system ATPase subunit